MSTISTYLIDEDVADYNAGLLRLRSFDRGNVRIVCVCAWLVTLIGVPCFVVPQVVPNGIKELAALVYIGSFCIVCSLLCLSWALYCCCTNWSPVSMKTTKSYLELIKTRLVEATLMTGRINVWRRDSKFETRVLIGLSEEMSLALNELPHAGIVYLSETNRVIREFRTSSENDELLFLGIRLFEYCQTRDVNEPERPSSDVVSHQCCFLNQRTSSSSPPLLVFFDIERRNVALLELANVLNDADRDNAMIGAAATSSSATVSLHPNGSTSYFIKYGLKKTEPVDFAADSEASRTIRSLVLAKPLSTKDLFLVRLLATSDVVG